MKTFVAYFGLAAVALASAQDFADDQFSGPSFNFKCPEPNGLFADPEQCDLYHVCVDGSSTAELCEDGLLFNDKVRNKERCDLPFGIDCGTREFVQEPAEGIDPVCLRSNGFFDHEDPNVCNKYYNCDKGKAYLQDCPPSTVFDSKIGNCVLPGTESSEAKVCGTEEEQNALKEIDGFRCTGKEEIGPNGLLQAHPIYPHPTDCQFFFTCFFGRDPNKFGCSKGQVFDAQTQVCKAPEDVPDCSCWYECSEDSKCPDSCNADCSCPLE